MTEITIAAEELGRSCPYCRFPLKTGVSAYKCDVCGAVHHSDCWQEGNGCAVFGCVGAGTVNASAADAHATGQDPTGQHPTGQYPSMGGPAYQPPPGAPWPPPTRTPQRSKPLIWALVAVLLAGAGVGIFLVASSASRTQTQTITASANSGTGASNTGNGATGSTGNTGTGAAGNTSSGGSGASAQANQVNQILQLSLAGRSDVQNSNYQGAIANRNTVLSRLGGLHPTDSAIAKAVATLSQAMRASRGADQAYASGTDPTSYDNQATQYKEQFLSEWSAIASQYGLPQYTASQI